MKKWNFSALTTGVLLGYITQCENIEMNTAKFWIILVSGSLVWNIIYYYCKKDD